MYEEFKSNADIVRALGEEQYRAEVYDDSPEWEVDIYDIGKYGGKWYELRATGCSCWGGEYFLGAGPFDTLDDLRAHIDAEYGNPMSIGYYAKVHEAWQKAFDKAASVA